MANIKGLGAAEFASGMYGVREANTQQKQAELDMQLAIAKEQRAAAEFEANRGLEDRKEDRAVRELELMERQFAQEVQDRSVVNNLRDAQAEKTRLETAKLRRAEMGADAIGKAAVTQALALERPDFLSIQGTQLYDQLDTLRERRNQIAKRGGDTTGVDDAIATVFQQYQGVAQNDVRVATTRALLGSINAIYQGELGEDPPENILALQAELSNPGRNNLTGATKSGASADDATLDTLYAAHRHAQRMARSKKERQSALDDLAILAQEATQPLKDAMTTVESKYDKAFLVNYGDEITAWWDGLYQLQTDLQTGAVSAGDAQAQLRQMRTRAGMMTANNGEGAVEMLRSRQQREADKAAFEEEWVQWQVYSALEAASNMGGLGMLDDVLGRIGGRAQYTRSGGLFDPRFSDVIGALNPDEKHAFDLVVQRAEAFLGEGVENPALALHRAVLAVDEQLAAERALIQEASPALNGGPGEEQVAATMAVLDASKKLGDGNPFGANEFIGRDGPKVTGGSRSVLSLGSAFKGNTDEDGGPVMARYQNRDYSKLGSGVALGPQAFGQAAVYYDRGLKTLLPRNNQAVAGILAALTQQGLVEAMDLKSIDVFWEPGKDAYAIAAAGAKKEEFLGPERVRRHRSAMWVFTDKAQEIMFNAGVDDMEGLIAALPNATAILAHADKYNPRFKDGLAGSEDSVWLKGPKSATKGK